MCRSSSFRAPELASELILIVCMLQLASALQRGAQRGRGWMQTRWRCDLPAPHAVDPEYSSGDWRITVRDWGCVSATNESRHPRPPMATHGHPRPPAATRGHPRPPASHLQATCKPPASHQPPALHHLPLPAADSHFWRRSYSHTLAGVPLT